MVVNNEAMDLSSNIYFNNEWKVWFRGNKQIKVSTVVPTLWKPLLFRFHSMARRVFTITCQLLTQPIWIQHQMSYRWHNPSGFRHYLPHTIIPIRCISHISFIIKGLSQHTNNQSYLGNDRNSRLLPHLFSVTLYQLFLRILTLNKGFTCSLSAIWSGYHQKKTCINIHLVMYI